MKAQVLRKMRGIVVPSRNRGVALVIALAMVVLLTVIVVAFFARSMLNRQIEASGAGREAADVLALSTLEALTGDMLNEMSAASTVETVSSVSLFHPASDEAIRPFRVVTQPFLNATNAKILLKQSLPGSSLFPANAPYNTTLVNRIFPAASEISTMAPSRDGRIISTNRWNTPRLLPSGFDAAGAPNWIYVARAGISSNQAISPAWSDYTSGNSNAIVGRVAFNVYETGALLNANVAGYPDSLTTEQVFHLKGSQAGADLRRLPGITMAAVNALVDFRNPQIGSAGAYTNYVVSGGLASGFHNHRVLMQDGSTITNSFFTSRQDLIRYAEARNPELTNALPYLTHTAFAINAPYWQPGYDANSKVGGSSRSEFQYRANATNLSSLNRDVLSVRFTQDASITSYRNSGSSFSYSVNSGDPLMQRRFSLNRLKWLGTNGPQNGGTEDSVRACFGLRWNNGRWQYVGPSGNGVMEQIKTLHEVAAENREPNFFEILQACILDGSLGVVVGNGQFQPAFQKKTTFQILRVGASLIDQYDEDSYPTVIEYDGGAGVPYWQAVGVENLPYIESVVVIAGPKPGDENNNLVVYALPRLWNPHRGSTTGDQPKIRIGIAGQLSARCFWGKEGVPPAGYPKAANDPKVPNMVIDGIVATAELAAVDTFPQPRYPAASDFASALSDNAAGIVWAPLPAAVGQHGGSSFVGFRFPDFHVDSTKMEDTGATDKLTLMTRFGNLTGAGTATSVANIYLEFRTPSGQWIPYAFFSGINDSATWMATVSNWSNRIGVSSGSGKFIYSPNPWTPDLLLAPDWFLKSDPRTSRISPVQMFQMAGMNVNPQPSLWSPNAPTSGGPANNLNFSRNGYGGGEQGTSGPFPRQADVIPNNDSSNGFYGGTSFFGNFYYPAWLSRNFGPNTSTGDQSSPRTSTYVDVDGVRRIADSGRYMNELPTGANAPTTGNPYWRQEDKPVVLNRPFESVGEMGYAFRDLPWKTLDFFSENSADAGLLDFFALTDADISVAADRLNVQNAPAEVLDALLAGTPVDVANSASAIFSQTAAWNISRKLAGTNSIMGSSADLVTRWVGPLAGDTTNPSTLPLLTDSDFDSSDIARVKPYREAIVRSLGGTSDLRTWNLMVDLIAQWGRFPPSAIGAADFIVNGEKRYWLHLSIDRFTGEVVSRQLEAVAE